MTLSHRRRLNGEETWYRLREWTKGQLPAERLAINILYSEGFLSIDPSHPLGGPDGIKDLVCTKEGLSWIGACYFPRGQKTFNVIKDKFSGDLEGVNKNNVEGLIFITNQELTLSKRSTLKSLTNSNVDIYHLERLAGILNNPINYGLRLEYLDIEMTPEEQLSYFAEKDKAYLMLTNRLDNFLSDIDNFKDVVINRSYLLKERNEEEIHDTIEELIEKVWYNRHQVLKYKIENGIVKMNPEI